MEELNTLENLESPQVSFIEEVPASASSILMKRIAWVCFAFFCLIYFTLLKLPEDRIKNFIDGSISSALAPKGISFSSADSKLSIFMGVSYKMKDVTLLFPPPTAPVHIEKLEISPSLLSMLTRRFGGNFWLTSGDGTLTGSASIKNTDVSISVKAKKFNLGKVGLLPLAAGIQGSAILDGSVKISGDMNVPSNLDGEIDLKLNKFVLDAQTIVGFAVPKLSISESVFNIDISKAKAVIKTLTVGKPGNTEEDLSGKITGDVTLGKTWDASQVSVKTAFSISPTLSKAFSLLDAILGAGKQADGSYAFNLVGSALSPTPIPVGPAAGP